MRNKLRYISIGFVVMFCAALLFTVIGSLTKALTSLQIYSTRAAKSYDYSKITTPLSKSVIDDVCTKFSLNSNDARCQPGSVVYGPDFFGDIKLFFNALQERDATFETVQNKLGSYLISCDEPDRDGNYSCIYDLSGDGIYPIGIMFTKSNYYYRIIANTGGS